MKGTFRHPLGSEEGLTYNRRSQKSFFRTSVPLHARCHNENDGSWP